MRYHTGTHHPKVKCRHIRSIHAMRESVLHHIWSIHTPMRTSVLRFWQSTMMVDSMSWVWGFLNFRQCSSWCEWPRLHQSWMNVLICKFILIPCPSISMISYLFRLSVIRAEHGPSELSQTAVSHSQYQEQLYCKVVDHLPLDDSAESHNLCKLTWNYRPVHDCSHHLTNHLYFSAKQFIVNISPQWHAHWPWLYWIMLTQSCVSLWTRKAWWCQQSKNHMKQMFLWNHSLLQCNFNFDDSVSLHYYVSWLIE